MLRLAFVVAFVFAAVSFAGEPGSGAGGPQGKVLRYARLVQSARGAGADVREAERLNQLSRNAAKAGDYAEADRLLDQAIALLAGMVTTASSGAAPAGGNASVPPAEPGGKGSAPVYLLPFTHHYAGPGGYYSKAAGVRQMAELLAKHNVPATLFFDGILVEQILKDDPGLITRINELKLPLGYHGEETHGPYPVGSELLGEVYTLHEAQGYRGQWSLTTGQNWSNAVRLVTERYSFARPWKIDEKTRMLERRQQAATDMSRTGGLVLLQKTFGRDVSMMPSHALESAPVGYAFRRMSAFGFDQPAVPVALHALKIFKIDDVADQIMSIGGAKESIFWYMGRISSKGDDAGEAGIHYGGLRAKLSSLDRSRPRLLLVGISRIEEDELVRSLRYLREEFFPANPGSGWVTGETLPACFEKEKDWLPAPADAQAAASALLRTWAARPPDTVEAGGRVISLCDAFEALARTLAGESSAGTAGAARPSVALHQLYGPVVENGGPALKAPATVTRAGIVKAAAELCRNLDAESGDRFVPAAVHIGDVSLNAGEFLYAMAAAVGGAGRNETISIPPSGVFPPYADLLEKVFKPRATQPLCYTKGQLWTVKPVRLPGGPGVAAKADSAPQSVNMAAATGGVVHVVFAANLDSEEPCFRDSHAGADLYQAQYDLVTGKAANLKRITKRAGVGEWFPAMSPDRSMVVYDCEERGRGDRLRHSLRVVTLASGLDAELVQDGRFPAFAADGRTLFFSRQAGPAHNLIMTVLSGGKAGREQVFADSRSLNLELAEDPGPFPDGRSAVFHRKAGGPQGAGVAVIGIDGAGLTGLTAYDGCGHAVVSPDGKTVACTRSRDGKVILVCREGERWLPPGELQLSTLAADYVQLDARFAGVAEVRHSYIEWVAPDMFLLTSHGADGGKQFRFARIFLVRLTGSGGKPGLVDISTAFEALAGKTGRDFCTASGVLAER